MSDAEKTKLTELGTKLMSSIPDKIKKPFLTNLASTAFNDPTFIEKLKNQAICALVMAKYEDKMVIGQSLIEFFEAVCTQCPSLKPELDKYDWKSKINMLMF
jgi:hypothetical protein